VPVVGTLRAAGFVDLGAAAHAPGDVRALSAAVDLALAFPVHHDAAARWRARGVFAEMQLANALRRTSPVRTVSPRTRYQI
jgi:hypothetical protein